MVKNAVQRVRARGSVSPVILLPLLDDLSGEMLTWVDEIGQQSPERVLPRIARTRNFLVRVTGSARHQRLAEFLKHCETALEYRQTESAQYILLTAIAALGWPAHTPPKLQ